MARVALDVMGGDFAPAATVGGALLALQELEPGDTIQLVGRQDVVERQLDACLSGEYQSAAAHAGRLHVVAAEDVIEMSEKPTSALRGKPRSSMHVGLRLQADGLSDAFVSAGNTGAQMAISAVVLRLHPGVARPAIATVFPTSRSPVVVLDSGANVDCSAQELVQFARLGAVYAETVLGRANPVVGLLNIGEEAEKGNAVTKETHRLLSASGLNFQGNIEGRDLPAGASDNGPVDVVVCDGFVGNVLLKFYEGIAPMMLRLLQQHAGVEPGQLSAALKHLDYSEYGGAPLLGVRGVSIISHGKSTARAIKNAIRVAARAAHTGLDAHIGARLAVEAEAQA